jgi:dTDP-4-amino-4,6-dideoxygalactose transaminase
MRKNATRSSAESAATPIFVQTAVTTSISELDRWEQITEEEAKLVYDMTLRNELSGGTPIVREFEQKWREMTGCKYALTTCNGTTALYSAFFGLGIGPGDEVICPSYTWICTISPVPFLGATPVFCESDPQTMQIHPADVRRRITDRTKAIVVVHMWGWVADMKAIMAISRETGIPVIEDCSHAHGALYEGRPVGSIGHVGAWSLQGTKPVSAGEGGVLATNDSEVFDRACLAGQVNRMAGMDLQTSSYEKYQPLGTGMKLRAHPLGIGIALIQLGKLEALNQHRRAYVEAVEEGLKTIPGLDPVPTAPGSTRGGFYSFPLHYRADELGGLPKEQFCEALKAEGIPATASPYELLHTMPIFAEGFDLYTRGRGPLVEGWSGYRRGDLPATEKMYDGLLFFPMLSDPVPGAVDQILDSVRKVVSRAAKR